MIFKNSPTISSEIKDRANNFNLIRLIAAVMVIISHSYVLTYGKDVKDLSPLKLSDIPRNIPKLDVIKKKAVMAPDKKRLKMFKCPQCGFTVKPYLVDNNPEEEENSDEQTN